ncbi:hypothetical protein WME94_06280 [Sorangium sp. So ce429]
MGAVQLDPGEAGGECPRLGVAEAVDGAEDVVLEGGARDGQVRLGDGACAVRGHAGQPGIVPEAAMEELDEAQRARRGDLGREPAQAGQKPVSEDAEFAVPGMNCSGFPAGLYGSQPMRRR